MMEEQTFGKRHWEQCPRDENSNRWATFHVTMNPRGEITLTKFVLDMLDAPEAFHLFFDRVNQTIGLKPTRRAMANAYPICPRGSHGGALVRAYRLCQQFGIRLNERVRFLDPRIDEDGILNLDLRKVTRSTQGRQKVRELPS